MPRLLPSILLATLLSTGAQSYAQSLADLDMDGVQDSLDNCVITPNPLQEDVDLDGDGDACECGDSSGDGRVDVVDAAAVRRCNAGFGSCHPLCDVTGEGSCDASDDFPVRRYLARDLAKTDLLCGERLPDTEIPLHPPEEEPPVLDLEPAPPGFQFDDPLVFRDGDLALDPGRDPLLPYVGATVASPGGQFEFINATTPATSSAQVAESLTQYIVETAEGRYAELTIGGALIRIFGIGSPARVTPPADVELSAPSSLLEDLELIKTFGVSTDPSGGQVFEASSLLLQDAMSGVPLDQFDDFDLQYLPEACDELAVLEYSKTGPLPPDLPTIHFPDVIGCSDEDCVKALHGWVAGHQNAWRAKQMMDFMANQNSYYRSFIWGQPGLDQQGDKVTTKSSPEYWFGPYAGYRFDAISNGIGKMRDMFKTLKTGGLEISLRCPDAGSDPGNVCFTSDASAQHWVKSDINLCSKFFGDEINGNPIGYWFRSHTIVHELMHHRAVTYKKGDFNLIRAIQDNHVHGHGTTCLASLSTIPFYGEDNVRHLATYKNIQQGHCKHRDKNMSNNDTYAFFATVVGDLVHDQEMWTWPAPAAPTPQPPDCDELGVEGCQCEDTLDFGEGSDPDGDYRVDKYCPNDDTELSCVKTKFNASSTVGVCVDCEELRAPGCECDDARPCDKGSCFGDDTFGGGVGHCYLDPPPEWTCLADCERLFNDPDAYCYHDALGGARCYDGFCAEPEAEACFLNNQTCREDQCIIECMNQAECDALGYPANFVCSNELRCEYPF